MVCDIGLPEFTHILHCWRKWCCLAISGMLKVARGFIDISVNKESYNQCDIIENAERNTEAWHWLILLPLTEQQYLDGAATSIEFNVKMPPVFPCFLSKACAFPHQSLWASGPLITLPLVWADTCLKRNLPSYLSSWWISVDWFSPSLCGTEWRGGDQGSPGDELCKGRPNSSLRACQCPAEWCRDEESAGGVQEDAGWDEQAGWGEPTLKGKIC